MVMGAGLASQVSIASVVQAQAEAQDAGGGSDNHRNARQEAQAGKMGAANPRYFGRVHLNQAGYLPGEPKRAIVPAAGPIRGNAFCILDDDVTPHIHYRGLLTEYAGPGSGQDGPLRHYFADFDRFTRPGRYRVRLSDGALSAPFSIGEDIYTRLVPLMLRYFDVQRCGDLDAGAHGVCHKDDGVIVGGPRNGQPIDASGGWHDAGDYMKFVETTSYVTALMLFAYDQFPHVFAEREPHSSLPQMLAQARVGLDWLAKMHPAPNEFYYQVGDASDHNTWRLPEKDCAACNKDWKPRPVFSGVGANLAGRTAAAFALASHLFHPYDQGFARRCLRTAQSVYRLGLENRQVVTTEPADFYPEKTWEDDMEWGAVALFRATGHREFLDQALTFAQAAGPAHDATSVYNTHAIAHYLLYPHAPRSDQERLQAYLKEDADRLCRQAENPYGLGAAYQWGTAEAAAGAALSCLLYARLSGETGENAYHTVARRQRDFILGCNPFGLSCLIGAGAHYPLFPHHQIADLKGIELSGALIGGPADVRTVREQSIDLQEAEYSVQPGDSVTAALSDDTGIYQDAVDNYVTNEPANDYTVKFLLLSAFYQDHLTQKEK